MIFPKLPDKLIEIASKIKDLGGQATLVGGWVRDSLLGIKSKDYDIEVSGIDETTLLKILEKFGKANLVGKAFGVYHLRCGQVPMDFSFPRTELKTGEGHRGFEIITDPSLPFEKASLRRDFTINAMGVYIPQMTLMDPQNGQKDLQEGVLKHVSDAFGEDPLRALRAIQFAARFNLKIYSETQLICQQQDLSQLSKERFEEEFKKLLLKADKPGLGIPWIKKTGIHRFFPELDYTLNQQQCLASALNQGKKYLSTLNITEKDCWYLMLTLLCYSMENPLQFLNRFTRDIKVIKTIPIYLTNLNECTTSMQSNTIENTFGWIRNLSLNMPIPFVYMLLKSIHAYLPQAEHWAAFVKKEATAADCWKKAPEPWIQGRTLIQLGQKPGPHFNPILKEIFALQIAGDLKSRDDALNWLNQKYLKSNN